MNQVGLDRRATSFASPYTQDGKKEAHHRVPRFFVRSFQALASLVRLISSPRGGKVNNNNSVDRRAGVTEMLASMQDFLLFYAHTHKYLANQCVRPGEFIYVKDGGRASLSGPTAR